MAVTTDAALPTLGRPAPAARGGAKPLVARCCLVLACTWRVLLRAAAWAVRRVACGGGRPDCAAAVEIMRGALISLVLASTVAAVLLLTVRFLKRAREGAAKCPCSESSPAAPREVVEVLELEGDTTCSVMRLGS